MLYPPGFYYVKKPKRFVILSSDKSSERNLSCFFDIKKPRRIEHLQSEEPFSSDPYFSSHGKLNWNLLNFLPFIFIFGQCDLYVILGLVFAVFSCMIRHLTLQSVTTTPTFRIPVGLAPMEIQVL